MAAGHQELAAEFGITIAHYTGQAQHNKVLLVTWDIGLIKLFYSV